MGIEIISGEQGPRKRIITLTDTRDNSQFEIQTRSDQELRYADGSDFIFPVDTAKQTQADTIILPNRKVVIWDSVRETVLESTAETSKIERGPGRYNIELTATPMKIYFAVQGSITVESTLSSLFIQIDGGDNAIIGGRSFHRTPETIIRTTKEPSDLAEAISHLSATISEDSPLRTYPTFRDHPPLLEVSEALDIPSDLDQPDTGIELHVPEDIGSISQVAPLAFYLGGRVIPETDLVNRPVLTTQSGFTWELSGEQNPWDKANQTLEQVFFLDCLARSSQLYNWDLLERVEVAENVDISFDEIFELPLAERVEKYLDLPYEKIESAVPDWPLTVGIEAPENQIEALPFIARDLAQVRVYPNEGSLELRPETFEPNTIEHAWAGNEYRKYTNRITAEAYKATASTNLTRSPRTKMIVVSNVEDDKDIQEYYNPPSWFNMDFEFGQDVTRDELRQLLSEPAGIFQFIGQLTEDGFRCSDGHLDTSTVFESNATTTLLHGCDSYQQAENLLEKGTYSCLVTHSQDSNEVATEFGTSLGKLIIAGFPLRTATNIVTSATGYSTPYTILGDGGIPVRHKNSSGSPTLLEIQSGKGKKVEIQVHSYVNRAFGLGSTFRDKFDHRNATSLNPTTVGPFPFLLERLIDELEREIVPVQWDGKIYSSHELLLEELPLQ